LDEFRHLFSKLSCCPLADLCKLDKMAVCRIACFIEASSVKISAKNQKKFAILTIRDGLESYELPIWADLYEQHQALLVETQLIYAVVQVEQAAEGIKLQAKWLGDLTKIDETMLFTCDAAYDKAKSMLKMTELKEKAKKNSAKEEKPLAQSYRIVLDVDRARISHVMSLKQIFRTYAGNLPVHIEFWSKNIRIGSLEIRAEWGVQSTKEIEDLVAEIVSVESVKLVQK
jgi:DNA polymerase-3 subunit alpha